MNQAEIREVMRVMGTKGGKSKSKRKLAAIKRNLKRANAAKRRQRKERA